ncbi:zinc finger MYND domain-containing protein 12 [Numida meleagris]|uniref:zinc finger MYND domain-containing protein 12 n=1 Tax=Numida meleagris TaxID=8996 RepID=UPI000B3DDC71|nr:zinc finger MYND domain-containing protein 12 [Numida meleagris]XP_021273461.1 zinc finger MYND domain-containing protein 12 [Numida meleagris]
MPALPPPTSAGSAALSPRQRGHRGRGRWSGPAAASCAGRRRGCGVPAAASRITGEGPRLPAPPGALGAVAFKDRPHRCHESGSGFGWLLRDVDHQKADWVSIHEKICQLLIPVRTSLPFITSEEERKHGVEQLVKRQKYIIDLTSSTAQKFIFNGKHKNALPAALHALRFSIEVYGSSSVQLVPAYLLLAEACLGTGNLQQASNYLSQAQWIVLRTPDCSSAFQHRLHRSLGLLYAADGNFEQALYHLANDIYFASSAFGLKSIETSGGYFHMANIFFHQNKMDIANSLYAEVTDIWHTFLVKLVQTQEQIRKLRAEKSPFTEDKEVEVSEDTMTEAQQAEAIQVLNAVLDIREKAPEQKPGETARVLHALAMLYYLIMDLSKACEIGMKAFDLLKQLPQQEPLEAVGHLLKLIDSQPSCTK